LTSSSADPHEQAAEMQRMFNAFLTVQALHVVSSLGIADVLHEPR